MFLSRRGSQGASRAAPGKSGLHARGEGEQQINNKRMLSLQKIIKSAGGPVGLRGSALPSVVTGPPRLCWGMIGAPRPRLELAPRSVWPWAPSCPTARQHPHLQVSLSPALSSQKVGENSRRGLDHQGLELKEEIQHPVLWPPDVKS